MWNRTTQALSISALLAAPLLTYTLTRTPRVIVTPALAVAPSTGTRYEASSQAGAVPTLAPPLVRVAMRSSGPSIIEGDVRDGTLDDLSGVHLTLFALPPPGTTVDVEPVRVVTQADERGHFSIEVAPGDYALYASDSARSSTIVSPISVSPGEAVSGLELTLTGSAVVHGVVLHEDAEPRGCSVLAVVPGLHVVLTDAFAGYRSGRFEMSGLPDGPLVLEVAPGTQPFEGSRAIDRPMDGVVIRVSESPITLVCEIVDEAGDPVPGAAVKAVAEHSEQETADEDGHATFTGLRGKLIVTAQSDDGVTDPVELDLDGRGQVVRLVLHRGATVRGRVVDAQGLPGIGQVSLDLGNRNVLHASVDWEGRYEITRVVPGRWVVELVGQTQLDPIASLSFVIGRADVELPDLRIAADRHISGLVVDENGEPVPSAEVDVVAVKDSSFRTPSGLSSDDEGRFELDVIGAVRLRAADEGHESSIVMLASGADEDVTLTLQSTGQVQGIVRGVSAGAEVRCEDGMWHPLDVAGQYNLDCLAGSALEVRDAKQVRSFEVDIDEGETRYAEIRW